MSFCIDIDDLSFKEEVENNHTSPVLVHFGALWCGPCRTAIPILEEIAEEYQNFIKVVRINTDENPIIAMEYGIRCIPTTMIFKEGKLINTIVGAVPRSTLMSVIEIYVREKNYK